MDHYYANHYAKVRNLRRRVERWFEERGGEASYVNTAKILKGEWLELRTIAWIPVEAEFWDGGRPTIKKLRDAFAAWMKEGAMSDCWWKMCSHIVTGDGVRMLFDVGAHENDRRALAESAGSAPAKAALMEGWMGKTDLELGERIFKIRETLTRYLRYHAAEDTNGSHNPIAILTSDEALDDLATLHAATRKFADFLVEKDIVSLKPRKSNSRALEDEPHINVSDWNSMKDRKSLRASKFQMIEGWDGSSSLELGENVWKFRETLTRFLKYHAAEDFVSEQGNTYKPLEILVCDGAMDNLYHVYGAAIRFVEFLKSREYRVHSEYSPDEYIEKYGDDIEERDHSYLKDKDALAASRFKELGTAEKFSLGFRNPRHLSQGGENHE